MKKIEAILRSEKVGDVRTALGKVGYAGLMISQIEGHGTQKGTVQEWCGKKCKVELLPKMKIDIVVKDGDAPMIVKAIMEAARTGAIGDGKIFVSTVDEVYRIRTAEMGDDAL